MKETSAFEDPTASNESTQLPENFRSRSFPLLVLFAIALFLRLYGISIESIWFDEAFSIKLARMPLLQIIRATAQDLHPPLYYMELNAWLRIFGYSAAAARGFSVLSSAVHLAFLYLLAKHLFGHSVAFMALLFAAVNPMDIYYAQETRMYSQWAGLGTASSFFLVRWFAIPNTKVRRRLLWVICYGMSCIGLIYLQLAGVFFLLAQGIWALLYFGLHRRWKDFSLYLFASCFCLFALCVWFACVYLIRNELYFSEQLAWMPMPTFQDLFLHFIRDFFWGRTTLGGLKIFAGACSLFGLTIALFLLGRTRPAGHFLFMIWMLIVPVLIAFSVSKLYLTVFYRPKFCLIVLPYFLIILAAAAASSSRAVQRLYCAIIVGIMIGGASLQLITLEKPGFRSLSTDWQRNQTDFLVVSPPYEEITLHYYLPAAFIIPEANVSTMTEVGSTICYCAPAGISLTPPFHARLWREFQANGLAARYYTREVPPE